MRQRKDFFERFLPGEFKKVRLRLGMTQAELAKEIDRSVEMVSKYETGKRVVPKYIVRKMRKISWAHRKTPRDKSKFRDFKSKSGVKGVVKRGDKWEARINIKTTEGVKRKHLGIFENVEDAIFTLNNYKET